MRVFVYGTLRRGGPLHECWLGGAEFVEARTERGRMFHRFARAGRYIGYPVVRFGEPGVVHGEVYDLDALDFEDLRRMEQAVGYRLVELADGTVAFDWPAGHGHGPEVESGDWMDVERAATRRRRAGIT